MVPGQFNKRPALLTSCTAAKVLYVLTSVAFSGVSCYWPVIEVKNEWTLHGGSALPQIPVKFRILWLTMVVSSIVPKSRYMYKNGHKR
jgi:hypothetical protein